MAITNLNEYYSSKGQALPSVSQRAGLASQAGISNYTGTAQQNAILLKSLTGSTPATTINTTGIVPPNATPTPTSAPVIPVGVVTSPQNQMQLPQQNTPVNTLGATAGSFLTQPAINTLGDLAGATQVAQQNADLARNMSNTSTLDLINELGTAKSDLNNQYGIQQLNTDQKTAKAKYDQVELDYRRKAEAETTNPALSAEQKQARLSELDRKKSSQLADIAIDYSLKAGLYNDAKSLVEEEYKSKLDIAKVKLDYYKELKNDYSSILDKTQTAQLNNLVKQEDRAFQEKQDKLKFQQQLQLKAIDLSNDLQKLGVEKGLSYDQLKGIKSYADLSKIINSTVNNTKGLGNTLMIKNIDDALKTGGGIQSSVGTGIFSRFKPFSIGKSQSFIGNIGQIAGQLTLTTLQDAKAKGATFGALSDSELRLIAGASSKLGTWAIKDKEGNITGWRAKESDVIRELNAIKDLAKKDYEIKTGMPYVDETTYVDTIISQISDPYESYIQSLTQ